MYVQSNTLLAADFRLLEICLEIYKLDPAKFLSAPGLVWQITLKKIKVKLDLLTDINMLLTVEKGIRGGICHAIYGYARANNKYVKVYHKNKKFSYLQYWDVNNLYGWIMPQKFPVNNVDWIKDLSQFSDDFIKNYHEESDEGYFLDVDFHYLGK